jgi:hypothetical protein
VFAEDCFKPVEILLVAGRGITPDLVAFFRGLKSHFPCQMRRIPDRLQDSSSITTTNGDPGKGQDS